MHHLVVHFETWVRGLVETPWHLIIALAVIIAAIAIGFRSKYKVFGRRNYSVDPEELRTFDEQEALEKWKREHEQDS